ncbi:MAG: hypothetical protein QNJ98_19440 [Planctomycetota bacterium]|nr:hypothetical protein [Planctomycetota bacterium]
MGSTRVLLACALLLTACGEQPPAPAPAPQEAAEWVRPYDGHVPDDDPHPVAVLLVVDARTGLPIEGAAVRHHYEIDVGPEGWAPLVQEAKTDRFGLVTMHVPREDWWQGNPPDGHWAIHAEGYASVEEYASAPADRIELVPARALTGRLVDALGRPLAGVSVGYKEGCAHAPFLAEAVTNADGVFVVKGILGRSELYYRGPGALADYFGVPLRHLDETPATQAAAPARRIHGKVTGYPVEQLDMRMVLATAESRGAFARIQDDGSFVIDGGHVDGMLTLWVGPDGTTRELSLDDVRPGGPFVWDLTLGDRDPTESEVLETRSLVVHVHGPDGKPVPAITVAAYRVVDGRTQAWADFDEDTPADAPYTLDLLPGAYDIVVGEDGEKWVADPVRVHVGREAPAPITIQARARAKVEVEWRGVVEKDVWSWHVAYAEPDGSINHVELDIGDEDYLFVPPEATARVAVQVRGMTRFFDVGPAKDGVRKAVVDWPEPRTIRFASGGKPEYATVGGVLHEIEPIEGAHQIRTHLEGRLRLRVWPNYDTSWGTRAFETKVDLTGPQNAVLDLGPITWPMREPGRVTLLDGEGAPMVDGYVSAHAYDLSGVEWPIDNEELRTDANGRVESNLLRPGAWIEFESTRDGRLHRRTLEGEGPWTFQLGTASIELEVHGRYGLLLDANLLMNGAERAKDGYDTEEEGPARFTVTGLEPGAYELVITAQDHRGQAHRVVLKPGETRTIRAELEPRR